MADVDLLLALTGRPELSGLPESMRLKMATMLGVRAPTQMVVSASKMSGQKQKVCKSKKKVYFLRVPKTASSSIADTLLREDCRQRFVFPPMILGHNEVTKLFSGRETAMFPFCIGGKGPANSSRLLHMADAAAHVFGATFHDSAESFVFAFVRNPFDRCVSSWKYCAPKMTFNEFVSLLEHRGLGSSEWSWHQRVHICEQWPLLHSRPDTASPTPTEPPTHKPPPAQPPPAQPPPALPNTSDTPSPTPQPDSHLDPNPDSKSKSIDETLASALATLDPHPGGDVRPPSPPTKAPSPHPPTGATVEAAPTLRAHFVGRFERLQQDFGVVAERIGLPAHLHRLPRKNTQVHKPYQDYYDLSLREAVARLYQKDLEIFGYGFEPQS